MPTKTTPSSVGGAAPAPQTKSDHLARDYFLRSNGALVDADEPNAQQPAITLMVNSARFGDDKGFRALGRYYHAVQVTGIAGSDSIAIEGSLDGTTFVAAASAVSALIANGIVQFTGLFNFLRATRSSGTGTATNVYLLSAAA